MSHADPIPESASAYRWTAALLIVGSALLRVVYLAPDCPLDLAPDEAHYWDWSRNLDWSYYSKGPLIAWLIRLSCELFGPLSVSLTGNEMLAVRIPAVVCGALLLASLYILTVQTLRSEKLALGVVCIALTLPLIAAGSSLMTIDAPFTCAWGWALVFGFHAVFRGSKWAWPVAGLCVLLGVLSKHTMVLWVPFLGLFLLMTPSLRHLLWRPGFWVLTGIGALGGLPILIWNAFNGWVTLKHTEGHAGLGDSGVHWLGPLRYLGMQFAVLLGFWFVAWARAVWSHRPTKDTRPEIGYLWWMSAPIIVFFGLFSLKNGGGEPNWPIAGYLSGMVLVAGWLATELHHPTLWYRRLCQASTAAFCALGLLLTLLVHHGSLLQPVLMSIPGMQKDGQPIPIRRIDPTCRLRGWRTLAAEVDRMRAQQRQRGEEPVLAGSGWSIPGEIGFYCEGHPKVYSLGFALGDRHSQYDLWRPNPLADSELFLGRTFLVVGGHQESLRQAFDRVEPTQWVRYHENGLEIASWPVTVAHGYKGFARLKNDRGY